MRQGHHVAWAVHARALAGRLPPRQVVYPLDAEAEATPDIAAPAVRGLESVRLFFEDYTLPMAQRALQPLDASARDFRPDVMVVDHQMPAGALVARRLGIPWVSLMSTSASIQRMSPTLDAWVAEQYQHLQAGYLAPAQQVERPDFSPYAALVFSIEALLGDAHARVPAPYHFVGPALGGARPTTEFPWSWLRDDCRRLLISLGTVSRDRDTRFFEVMMAALTDLPGVQAVMVAPLRLAAQAPPNVLVREYLPQLDLLARVHGVVCHAGHNTVCETLMHDLPLVVAPIRDDQPVIARQVIDAGAALFMRYGKVSVAVARDTLQRLLDTPVLAQRAAHLGAQLRQASGAAGAAAQILALVPPARRQVA